MKKLTINDIYNFCREKNINMLSDYDAPFWKEYVQNYASYDRAFNRKFKTFVPANQEEGELIDNVVANFILDVQSVLTLNKKKYEELFRIEIITDKEYSITENYNTTEEMVKATTEGERVDSATNVVGEKNTDSLNQITPYDSHTFNDQSKNKITEGSQVNTDDITKGAQNNTEEYTFTKHGNIGVQTGSDLLEKHKDFWDKYNWYQMIFSDICAELLLVEEGGDYEYYFI